MNLKPIGDRVIVKREAAEGKTAGGIILPDSAKNKPQKGTVLAVGATLVIAWFTPRCRNAVWAVALGLVLAGVDGNLVDRLFRAPGGGNGCVVDFIAFPHYPIFNVADMCINVGAALIVVQLYRGVHLNGTRTAKKARP